MSDAELQAIADYLAAGPHEAAMIRATRRARGRRRAGGCRSRRGLPRLGGVRAQRSACCCTIPRSRPGAASPKPARRAGATVRAIDGDRIRFAREVFERAPGATSPASAARPTLVLIEDVAREAGYRPAATIYGRERQCAGYECLPGWQSLGHLARTAGGSWVEALADYAARPGETAGAQRGAPVRGPSDTGLVLGWVLAPR